MTQKCPRCLHDYTGNPDSCPACGYSLKPLTRKFCSKCGKPVGECTCGVTTAPSVGFGSSKSALEEANRTGSYYVQHFDKIALIQGEIVVKEYHIGEFAKGLGRAGKGSASIIVTNKRVISKQDSDFLGSSSTYLEEITLDNVAGVKNYFSQGFTIWRVVVAAIAALAGIVTIFSSFGGWYGFDVTWFLLGLLYCFAAVYMGINSRKPSYLFSIYAASANQAMFTGVNLRGKIFNSGGYGILFQYKPTQEAVKMMCEIGACIVDLKMKGDYAIEAWKKA